MARSNAAWGIDIGNCSLKALRCRLNESGKRLIADAFDFIEYPKILTQPGAEPAELVGEALTQFLSRNSVRGDRVAVSVAGHNGLARFIKLPPVESKKIPAIVHYEARQQIPFDLRDVIWDYQRMGGGAEEEGFVLEAEIGLFAMKRDQVYRALEPFRKAGIEVDVIQLSPLCLYNYFVFDRLQDVEPPDEMDPESQPSSTVLLSLGTDATDLVITNGFKVWQRSIPLGGNQFTKALTKELKLTFAKAEHLKRNATAAPDPKAVFQAMRPVFNDLLTEIQRSIGYFTTIDRNAKVEGMVAMGNAMKLPGLRRYLSQSLGFEVERLESFENLSGAEVLGAGAFKENLACFGTCYGLAVQALGQARLRTNLLPVELVKDRIIRAKKPWAVAAAALLLLACTISFVSHSRALSTVDEKLFTQAEQEADSAVKTAQKYESEYSAVKSQFDAMEGVGKSITGGIEGRTRWLELLKAITECLPRDPVSKRPADISERNEVYITNVECQAMEKLEDWFAAIKQRGWYQLPPSAERAAKAAAAAAAPPGSAPAPADGAAAAAPGAAATDPAANVEGPKGPGYLIQLTGFHFHNKPTPGQLYGAEYLRHTIIEQLHTGKVLLPKTDTGDPRAGVEPVSMSELGISGASLVEPGRIEPIEIPDPDAKPEKPKEGMTPAAPDGMMPGGMMPGGPMMGGPMMGANPMTGAADQVRRIRVLRFPFVIQFAWQPTPPEKRQEKKAEQAKAQQEAAPAGPQEAAPPKPTP